MFIFFPNLLQMPKFYTFLSLFLAFLVLSSCTKEEEVIIPDNVAPPDETISDVILDSYINRAYISLLARKPTESEESAAKTGLRNGNMNLSSRESMVDGVLANQDYLTNLFDQARVALVNGTDTSEFQNEIALYQLLLTDPQYAAFYPFFNEEIDLLEKVLDIPTDLANGSIDIVEVHRRLIHNKVYDDINMGTQNFVISMFQNFLGRYPTGDELERSELMVDGFASQIFLQVGDSKDDFIDIFFNSLDYFEGQVTDLYNRYLFRAPSSVEMSENALNYQANQDYKALQKSILTSAEFAGL